MSEETLLAKLNKVIEDLLKSARLENLRKELKKSIMKELTRLSCREWQKELVAERIRDIVRGELLLGRHVVVLEAKLGSPGIIGMGSGVLATILEVGLAWDYVVDLPLISGSAFKGAFRDTAIQLCARGARDKLKCLEEVIALLGRSAGAGDAEDIAKVLEVDNESVRNIVRGSASRGLLVFHDTYLICGESGKLLEGWVITPHYEKAGNEYEVKTVPVQHVVLASGLYGVFIVGVDVSALNHISKLRELLGEGSCSGKTCLAFLSHILAATLASGVGARTSRGYTQFGVVRVYVR